MTPPSIAGDDYDLRNIIINAVAVSGTTQYTMVQTNSDTDGNIRFELESMFFEAPENLTLVFNRIIIFSDEHDDVEISIPLRLAR